MAAQDGSGRRDQENFSRIIVVGAGIAGLSAANELIRNGIKDFRILEAQKRAGGRIKAVGIGEQEVELGATWIHGVLGNPIYELALAHGLVDVASVPRAHRMVALTEHGKRIPFEILREVYEAYICFFKRCEEYFSRCFDPPEGVKSVGAHVRLEVDLYLRDLPPEEASPRRLIFEHLLRRESCVAGCDSTDQLDLLEVGSYMELPGGNVGLVGRYSAIFEPLLSSLLPGTLLTEKVVKKVKWDMTCAQKDESDSDDSDRTVKGTDNLPHVTVQCEDGSRWSCNHVICTLPLGVLKSNPKLFSPPLPAYKTEAASKLLFATVDKIFLEYERPFLDPDISEVVLLWETNSSHAENLQESWMRKIHSFSKVNETLLLAWISGKEAEFCETLSLEEVARCCTKVLRRFLSDPYVPEPKSCVRSHWYSQPFTRGSYTAIGVGGSQIDIEMLGRPIYANPTHSKPVLLFAGEHTHPCFYSTVHGAYLTGRTAAQLLCTPESPFLDDHSMDLKEEGEEEEEEEEKVLQAAGVTDLSTWVQGISLG